MYLWYLFLVLMSTLIPAKDIIKKRQAWHALQSLGLLVVVLTATQE